MRIPQRALGMYPDETCFDTTRPGWLPYWIDDITESACKLNLLSSGNTTGNTAQPSQTTTVTNPDGSTSVVSAAEPATIQNAQAACASSGGRWDPNLNTCLPSLISQLGMPVIIGSVAVLALVLVMRK